MEYSIHKRRKLRPSKRQKAILPAPVIERTVVGARQQRREHAPSVARPEPDHVVAPEPPVIVTEPPAATNENEPAYVSDRRELVRLIHQTQSFPVGLQRTIAEPSPPEKVATGSVVQRRPLPDDE